MRSAHPLMLFCLVVVACLGQTRGAEENGLAHDEEALREANLGVEGVALLEFFHRHTISADDETEVRQLIRQMGADRYRMRERATSQLTSLGSRAVPLLRTAVTSPDLEIARRAERCLKKIEEEANEPLLTSAAHLIAARKPEGADRVLLDYLASAEKEYLIESAIDALAVVGVKEGKPTPVVREALIRRDPHRRAAAAIALIRAGVEEEKPAVRRLLDDNDPLVRMRVGLALALAGDQEAVRPLIEMLDELPDYQTGRIEDLLYRLSGEKAPQVPSGREAEDRKKVRAAWEKWYEANAGKLEMAKLDGDKPCGHTLAVLLDAGKIVDLDAAKKVCWQIEGLKFPLDAQILPGRRVLIAEYEGELVTERDSKGKILWQHDKAGAPLCAQRLPDGTTFIATASVLLEVDRKGKEVWKHTVPEGVRIMKATRLRNGNVAMIGMQNAARFSEIGRDGKEVRGFAVEQRTSGGRVEVLPGGHLLIAEKDANRIVELDYQGKPAWEARFDQPVAAVRLPSGHTLVTSIGQFRAVELDRSGKEVWEYRADTRVTRAWRY